MSDDTLDQLPAARWDETPQGYKESGRLNGTPADAADWHLTAAGMLRDFLGVPVPGPDEAAIKAEMLDRTAQGQRVDAEIKGQIWAKHTPSPLVVISGDSTEVQRKLWDLANVGRINDTTVFDDSAAAAQQAENLARAQRAQDR